VKEFVSEIVRHAIVLKEQEIRLKAKLKVWKYDPEEVKLLFYFIIPFSPCAVLDFCGKCRGMFEVTWFGRT